MLSRCNSPSLRPSRPSLRQTMFSGRHDQLSAFAPPLKKKKRHAEGQGQQGQETPQLEKTRQTVSPE
jgi:hypothetical protein